MKKILCIVLSTVLLCSVCFTGCSQFDIAEQPDRIIIYAEKIYPSAIGNYLSDPSVEMPCIDAYMKEYNKNAEESARINYSTIKYNKQNGYYYVNDNMTDLGMKFYVDSAGTICNVYIYTGTVDQPGKNVYNIVINAIETAGYKSLMTEQDKAIIQHTLNGFNSVEQSKNEVMQIFGGQENFSAKWNQTVAEFEIPIKPTEMPKPDTSHTLPTIEYPEIEIPEITLDTTIVEGLHLQDGTEVTTQDMSAILEKLNATNKEMAKVTNYLTNLPEGANKILDAIAINQSRNEVQKLLDSVSADVNKLLESDDTKELPITNGLVEELEKQKEIFKNSFNDAKEENGDVTPNVEDLFNALVGPSESNRYDDINILDENGNPTSLAQEFMNNQLSLHGKTYTLPPVEQLFDSGSFKEDLALERRKIESGVHSWSTLYRDEMNKSQNGQDVSLSEEESLALLKKLLDAAND